MENSPPGTQAIPAGAFVGAAVAFGTVGPNETSLAAGIAGVAGMASVGATVFACTGAKCL